MKYTSITPYLNEEIYYNFFVGGRGVGKTHSTIEYLRKQKQKFIYLRTTTKELELAVVKNDFAKQDSTINFQALKKDLYGIYKEDVLIGYGAALSTFKNLRGVDFSDVMIIFHDEFISERSARKVVKYELDALLNLLESINHNREFEGIDSCRYIGCANSNEIYNPYFIGLNILEELEVVLSNGQRIYKDPARCLQVVVLDAPKEFIDAKRKTPLYRLAAGTEFEQMALENQFSYNDFSMVKDLNIKGFEPQFKIDDCVLWKRKNDDLYILKKSTMRMRNCFNTRDDVDMKILYKLYSNLFFRLIANNRIYFQNYEIKRKLFDILKIKC